MKASPGRQNAAQHTPPVRNGVGPSLVGLPDGAWATVADFLAERFPAIPRADWLKRMSRGLVVDLAGTPVPPTAPYRAHSRLFYYRDVEDEIKLQLDATILFQDRHLLVADKPHFLPSVPGGQYLTQTLLVKLKQQLGIDSLAPLHRLDRETAGITLFSIRPEDRNAYHRLFRERLVHKHYEAIAPARPELAFPRLHRSCMAQGEPFFRLCEVEGAVNSETQMKLLEQRGAWARYSLSPLTGKRHQLRVHMAAIGAPIRNDRFYPVVDNSPEDMAQPLQLLARAVRFTDPVTGELRVFESARRLVLPDA
ncbi:pseudouridine synthase [Variovorax sp. HJSM1_2]|uniref:pseudouridine synthase n=1 Tax=Variovorax sp. HJSM1_2 TaxID=3366263 RepID=UPI003BBFB10C